MIRKALIALAVLGVVVGVASIVISMQPGTFTVQRSASMAAAPPEVFALVDDLGAWDSWSPWNALDPDAKRTISTPSAGTGATFAWSGNDAIGEGSLTILDSRPYERVDIEQAFVRPFAGSARMSFTFAAAGEGTEVTWRMEGTNNFIGKAMCMIMDMDAILGKSFAEGLANMKAVVEKGGAGAGDGRPPRHLIYLHGRIVQEQQSARPLSPQFGYYELGKILDAFRDRGFVVSGEIRPKPATVSDAADRVVGQVRLLLASGVTADHVTVVGGSMGAAIALLAAARLRDPEVRFAVLGACLSGSVRGLVNDEGNAPGGHVLAIREASDETTTPCPAWTGDAGAAPALVAREIVLDTGLGHGFLYRPIPEWVDPVAAWADAAGRDAVLPGRD